MDCILLKIQPKKLLHVDFLKGSLSWRLKRRDHETLLKKAIGKKIKI